MRKTSFVKSPVVTFNRGSILPSISRHAQKISEVKQDDLKKYRYNNSVDKSKDQHVIKIVNELDKKQR